jgi:hypothetical protein
VSYVRLETGKCLQIITFHNAQVAKFYSRCENCNFKRCFLAWIHRRWNSSCECTNAYDLIIAVIQCSCEVNILRYLCAVILYLTNYVECSCAEKFYIASLSA